MVSTPTIFINYRREDSSFEAHIIYGYLTEEFGKESVFKDDDTIPAGVDFRQHIGQAVGKCQILLAVIGKNWLDIEDENGKRRLDHSEDFVRFEIETAFKEGIPVIPVLFDDVCMPSEATLPGELKGLAHQYVRKVRSGLEIDKDMERLITDIRWITTGQLTPVIRNASAYFLFIEKLKGEINRKIRPISRMGCAHTLVVECGGKSTRYTLVGQHYILGSLSKSCDIVVQSPLVCPNHLSLTRDRKRLGNPFVMKDKGSTNGIYYKSKRVSELILRHDTVFSLGHKELSEAVTVRYHIDWYAIACSIVSHASDSLYYAATSWYILLPASIITVFFLLLQMILR